MVMLRSLTDKNIKFEVFCDLDCKMTKAQILNIICEMESHSAYICPISSDQGGTNQGLFRDLGIIVEKPNIVNPVDDKILVHGFYDWIHAQKNILSNMMDHTRVSPTGRHTSKEDFEDLLPCITAEISTG